MNPSPRRAAERCAICGPLGLETGPLTMSVTDDAPPNGGIRCDETNTSRPAAPGENLYDALSQPEKTVTPAASMSTSDNDSFGSDHGSHSSTIIA